MAQQPVPVLGRRARWRAERAGEWAWRLLGLMLCALVFGVLPGGRIRLGAAQLQGLVGSYLYAVPTQLVAPSDLRVTQIYLPKTIRVEWDQGIATGNSYLACRVDPSTGYVLATKTGTDPFWDDRFDFESGKTYEYRVQAQPPYNTGNEALPSPPSGADPNDIGTYYTSSEWTTIRVVPMQSVATANQTVDSRWDLRYGNPTLLDFKFGNRTYRGGLFTGFASDPSRVGRSFLKFGLPALPAGASYWAGSVNAYHTCSFMAGNREIGCQEVADVTWDPATLRWSVAPTLNPGDAVERFTVTYDPNTPANTTTWAHWGLNSEIENALSGAGLLSVGLASTSETSNGWVYFAKKEYDATQAPAVLYAYQPAP